MPADAPRPQGTRPWLIALLGAAVVALIMYASWPSATPAPQPSNQTRAAARRPAAPPSDAAPFEVKLDALKQPPPEPAEAERNPFRFQPKAPPPPPPSAARGGRPPMEPAVPVPAGPPQPPPIPLKFIGLVDSPSVGKIAALTDGRGAPVYGREGQIVLGQYRIVKIGVESIVVEYVDGTGRRTIPLTGQ